MCGIAGIISLNAYEVSQERLKLMTNVIAHRGPDGDGQWISENGHVGLGHRRLSIIDLSHEADQPMHYLNRYTIVFNGEIYNYIELKAILVSQGYNFKTSSDTEVLLALYYRDGEKCLSLLDGMFAFVIYDRERNEVFAARDRFGEKPFFYSYKKGEYFVFGSEMKVLWAAGIAKEVNDGMLFKYLRDGSLENSEHLSETFYKNCDRLVHSHYIKFSLNNISVEQKQYYDIDWRNIDSGITELAAGKRFKELFFASVEKRLRSDVPVGSSLSGGLDSSLVVAVIDNFISGSGHRQDTFSAVFPGFKKDERQYMNHVISRTNVNPHFVTPSDVDMVARMDELFYHQEEPFGTASIFVQYSVMKLARENNVTVLLDGQGADEILAGYHFYYEAFFKSITNKKELDRQLQGYKELQSDNQINPMVNTTVKQKIYTRLAQGSPRILEFYHKTKLEINNPFNSDFYGIHQSKYTPPAFSYSNLNEALYNSTFKNGLQELLRYADRNSMAHSREVRLPFLNHELVDFLFTLPPQMKINLGWTKWIMRNAFADILPPEIAWRKDKIGYEPPQGDWLKNKDSREIIFESKRELVNKNIISKKFLNVTTENNQITDWKLWMAGLTMQKQD